MLLEIAGGVFFAPLILLLSVILLLASFGKSFGIRKVYVDLLLRLFEVRFILSRDQLIEERNIQLSH